MVKLYEFSVVIAAKSEHQALKVLTDRGLNGDPIDERDLPEEFNMNDIDDYVHAKQEGLK
jgi:hypothetical protein